MEKELLFSVTKKDLDIQTFRSGGHGGQYQNTTDSGVRIVHKESGAVGESRSERSQYQNKRLALERLVASSKFQAWHKKKSAEMLGQIKTKEQIEREVNETLANDLVSGKIKIEGKVEGKWEPIKN